MEQQELPPKERHGCVTAWLIFMIAANSLVSLFYFISPDRVLMLLPKDQPKYWIYLLGIVGIANVFFSFMLLRWKKIGFFGVIATCLSALLINLKLGLGIASALGGLLGVLILFLILQISVKGKKAWELME